MLNIPLGDSGVSLLFFSLIKKEITRFIRARFEPNYPFSNEILILDAGLPSVAGSSWSRRKWCVKVFIAMEQT